nr:unnamed protein product [Callosobruchus analis]
MACPMFVTKPGDERPYLDVQILGEPLIALADSGSSISILGNLGFALLEKWNVKLSLDYSLQVTTADGVPQASIGNFIVPITLAIYSDFVFVNLGNHIITDRNSNADKKSHFLSMFTRSTKNSKELSGSQHYNGANNTFRQANKDFSGSWDGKWLILN